MRGFENEDSIISGDTSSVRYSAAIRHLTLNLKNTSSTKHKNGFNLNLER